MWNKHHAPRPALVTSSNAERTVDGAITSEVVCRNGLCPFVGMSTDEHYNEPGGLPRPLEDHEPTDMPATRGIFLAVVTVGLIALIVLVILQVKF